MHKQKLTILGLVFVLLVLISILVFRRFDTEPGTINRSLMTYASQDGVVSFRYPDSYVSAEIDQSLQQVGTFVRLIQTEPSALLSVRKETGLGVLRLAGSSILDALVDNVNNEYPNRFPGYEKRDFEKGIIANEEAAQFEFTYRGTDGQTTVRQWFVIIVRDGDGYFFSLQAPDQVFPNIRDDFQTVLDSLEFK